MDYLYSLCVSVGAGVWAL
jgi:hypothetical protein